jgi:DNA-binding transcriptional LysR family regulator
MLTTRHLHQILTIAELGTFNQAAQQLNLSQPALTASIKTLEARLGLRLFERSKKGAEPTVFGQHVIASAPDILSRLNRLEDELGLLAGAERGTLRVAAGPVAIHGVLRQVLPAFCRRYPNIELTVLTSSADQIAQDVAAGRLDLGIGALDPALCGAEVITRRLYEETLYVVSRPAHPLQSADHVTLADVLSYPVSLPEVPQELRAQTEAQIPPSGPPLRAALTTDQYDLILGAVMQSDMLTSAPYSVLRPYLEAGQLQLLHHDGPHPTWCAMAAYRAVSALSPAFMALLANIEDWFAHHAALGGPEALSSR